MIDREKVIKGLECCSEEEIDGCNFCELCPYHGVGCVDSVLKDALELLKAQKPVEPVQDMVGDTLFWVCGRCGHDICSTDWYCANCGRAVKWDE